MDPRLLQTQLKQNNLDLQEFAKDLTNWSNELGKDEHKEKPDKFGNKKSKTSAKNEVKHDQNITESQKEPPLKIERLAGGDYKSWEKYDADAECQKIDSEPVVSTADYDEVSDEFDDDAIEAAKGYKDTGNNLFKSGDFNDAIKSYSKAIECYAYDPVFYANRAMCYLKQDKFVEAEIDCTNALHLDKTYVKAYQRRASAREKLGRLAEAKDDILHVFDYEPRNKESISVLKSIEAKMIVNKKTESSSIQPSSTIINPIKPSNIVASTVDCRPISKFAQSRSQTLNMRNNSNAPLIAISNKIVEHKSPSTQSTTSDIPWPTHDSKLISSKSISKAPNKRSQSPLRRVKVMDSNASSILKISHQSELRELNIPSLETPPILTTAKPNISNIKDVQTTNKSTDLSIDLNAFPDKVEEDFSKLKKHIPKSAVQFLSHWKSLNVELRYLYLRQINPKNLSRIFSDALDSSIFTDILYILSTEYIARQTPVENYLYFLTTVPRFSALVMFKSSKDETALRTLLEYVRSRNSSGEMVDFVLKKYELL